MCKSSYKFTLSEKTNIESFVEVIIIFVNYKCKKFHFFLNQSKYILAMSFFKFLFSKWFLINVLLAVAVVVIGLFTVLGLLENVTQHGKTITVPDLKTYTLDEVDDVLTGLSLNYKVIDSSAFTPEYPKNSVIKQDPKNGSSVKEGRVIYLTINSGGYSSVQIPNLIGRTNRQAVSYLEAIGFRVGKFEYRRDVGKNVVLDLKHNGQIIDTLTSLPKQSVIDLVLGTGNASKKTNLPYMLGSDLDKAKDKLVEVSLNLGKVKYDEEKREGVKYLVYRQYPEFKEDRKLNMGTPVSLWLTSDTLKIPERIIEEELEEE